MAVEVQVRPEVVEWAVRRSGKSVDDLEHGSDKLRVRAWLSGEASPTLRQLERFARASGVPFGYLLLPEPPQLVLPVPDFRAGFAGHVPEPSADLMAVVTQSVQRQEWFIEYAREFELGPAEMVGVARAWTPEETAADMRRRLAFEVQQRPRESVRAYLIERFEELGGLSVVTSMVGNNNHRMLDADEFRGFSLVDRQAPLVFLNANQTMNGQVFTLAHELAHVWRGRGGIGNTQRPEIDPSDPVERWCNRVAAEFLVPRKDLAAHYPEVADLSLPELLDRLAKRYRCGTLVILQALHRQGLRAFPDFSAAYAAEVKRLSALTKEPSGGGDFYRVAPLRIGRRFSQALIADTLAGRTQFGEALQLMSMKSTATFDEYAKRLELL